MSELTPDQCARFWSRVQIATPNDCWEWSGWRMKTGYGGIYCGQQWLAHRLAWTLTNGAIPPGMSVLHRCDNPPCCNPAHLFLGTQQDNLADMCAKHRNVRHPGEQAPAAKLSNEQANQIRALYQAGGVTQTALAERFGITNGQISRIVNGICYKPDALAA